ncbi:HIT-like domain-containing protein [Peziza echinospora]|nr:HIT-like domain-containing protein [Peziza echinospora]
MSTPGPTADPSCPFCEIATTTTTSTSTISPSPQPPYLLLATPTVLAFLDTMPLTPGHVLLIPRAHYGTLSDVPAGLAGVLGMWVAVVARGVCEGVGVRVGGVEGELGDVGGYNIVQNNGKSAAQVVPHVHYHVIPRAPLTTITTSTTSTTTLSTSISRSSLLLGRGPRQDLDDDEATLVLCGQIRRGILRAVRKEFGLGELEGFVVGEKEEKEQKQDGCVGCVVVGREEERRMVARMIKVAML